MRRLLLTVLFLLPGAAAADEPPAALPPGYEAVYRRCRETGKAMVVWVNVKRRVVAGAVGLECQAFPGVNGAGIVVGVWKGDTLLRHDLPAGAADAAISALYAPARPAAGNVPPPRVVTFGPPRYPVGWPGGVCVGGT